MNFSELKEYFENLPQQWHIPACSLVVRVGRETVFESYQNTKPGDAFWMYSATKVFTAVEFCRLLERGKLQLTDKVSDYLPEYAHLQVRLPDGTLRAPLHEPTLHDLITMCGGLNYDIVNPLILNAEDKTTRGIVREIAKMPLDADPGEKFIYSLCHDVLAAVMEVVTGTRFADLLKKEISEPLGMVSTEFHPDAALSAAMVQQYIWNADTNRPDIHVMTNKYRFSDSYDSGGAGLCSTLEDYILLPEALANGGLARNGYVLLKPETIELMRQNHLTAYQTETMVDHWNRLRSYSYGLGVRTKTNFSDGGISPLGEFGWDGAAGAFCMIDPDNHISAFYAQHIMGMSPVYQIVHPTLRNLIYKSFGA